MDDSELLLTNLGIKLHIAVQYHKGLRYDNKRVMEGSTNLWAFWCGLRYVYPRGRRSCPYWPWRGHRRRWRTADPWRHLCGLIALQSFRTRRTRSKSLNDGTFKKGKIAMIISNNTSSFLIIGQVEWRDSIKLGERKETYKSVGQSQMMPYISHLDGISKKIFPPGGHSRAW